MALIQPQKFAIACVTGVTSFASWRQGWGTVFDVSAEAGEMACFAGDLSGWSTDHYVMTRSSVSRINLIRSLETLTRSNLDHFGITRVLAGGTAGMAGSIELIAEEGDVFISDLSQAMMRQTAVHRDRTAEVTLWVSRRRFLASVGDESALHGLVLRAKSAAGAAVGASLETLLQLRDDVSRKEVDAVANGIVELAARAMIPHIERLSPLTALSPEAPLVIIRRYIDRNLRSATLDTSSIAKTFGLSRASLYRLFEPIGGIASYIRKARLSHAYQQIAASEYSDRRIAQIAFAVGFKNVSSFNRLFQSSYGLTPRQVRERVAHGSDSIVLKAGSSSEVSVSSLLAQISAQ